MILLPGSEYIIINSQALISLVSGTSQKRCITFVIRRYLKVWGIWWEVLEIRGFQRICKDNCDCSEFRKH